MRFQRGETVETYVETKTQAGVLSDPTSVKITITDPAGTVKSNAATMDQYLATTGKYVYYYSLASDAVYGQWTSKILVTDGAGESAKTTVVYSQFDVMEN